MYIHSGTFASGALMENGAERSFLLGREKSKASEAFSFGFQGAHQATTEQRNSDNLIRYASDAPLMTFAPTGAGKSAGPVISNLLDYPGSVICLEVEGKIHAATTEHLRQMGQDIHVLDLQDGDRGTGSLNPFDIARRLGIEVSSTCRSFASEIVQQRINRRDAFWNT